MRTKGPLHRVIDTYNDTFRMLGIAASPAEIETLAVTVHRAMTAQTRHYHGLDHVFTFFDSPNLFGRLAALYHDIVYYQVDEGFTAETRAIVAPYIREDNGDVYIAGDVATDDCALRFPLAVFDVEPGQCLSLGDGLNEFLSALVMNKALGHFVPQVELLKMTAYLEATIPFRKDDERGKSHFDVLEERLQGAAEAFQLSLSPEEIAGAVRVAVWFSNKDVESFAEEDTRRFVDGTWKLLHETNPALRSHRGSYSIREYRQALQRAEAFLSTVSLDAVFHRHRGTPSEAEFAHMVERAAINVRTAVEYLRIKLLTIAIIEALAEVSGGNAAIALFMGDLPERHRRFTQLTDFLPAMPSHPAVDSQSIVMQLLTSGRPSEVSFDSRQSPLSAFLYSSLGPAGTERALRLARDMFAGRLFPETFLQSVDAPVIRAVARATAEMVPTRRDKLLEYASP